MGPACITIRVTSSEVLLMIQSGFGCEHFKLGIDLFSPRPWYDRLLQRKWPTVKEILHIINRPIWQANYRKVKGLKLSSLLLKLNESLVICTHKIGIVYAGPNANQTDFNAILSNNLDQCSAQFWRFMRFLGDQVHLKGWWTFSGGLDTINGTSGKTMFYTKWQQLQFAFHVAPLIPCPSHDEQFVNRKKHVGNDIVLIIFQHPAAPAFKMSTIHSRQVHAVIIVRPTSLSPEHFTFQVELYRQKNMPDYTTFNLYGELSIDSLDNRDQLLATVVEAERASYKADDFAQLLFKTRSMMLNDLINKVELIGYIVVMTMFDSVLAIVGTVTLLSIIFKFASIALRLYFTPSTNWNKYGAKKGTWAIITGSTDGIGKEFAFQLAKKGFNIMLLARNAEKLQATKQQILKEAKSDAITVETVQVDFSESKEFEEKVKNTLKGKKISILVNNVGTSHGHPEYFTECTIPTIDTIVNVNILNTLRLTRLVLPGMVEQKSGLVLNLGSFSGETPIPLLQTYSASKAFLKSWSTSLASEVSSSGVDVQLLNTYFVVSNMSKFRRPTFMIPTPKTYVAAALRTAGQNDFTTPYGPHAFLNQFMGLIPTWILVLVNRAQMRKVRQIALQKANAVGGTSKRS